MGFRTVIVNSRCKLEFRLNFMILRGETEKRIYIDEINTLIVQSTAVSLTAALLGELVKNSFTSIVLCIKYRFFLIESRKKRRLLAEERAIIITEDLCEIVENFSDL